MEVEYAVFKGDTFLCLGTAEECAEYLNIKPETVKFYTTPIYKRRVEKRKRHSIKGYITVEKMEDDEFEKGE